MNEINYFHVCLFIVVLLAIVKPLFSLPLFGLLLLIPFCFFKTYIRHRRNIISLAFVILPLILQLAIMKIKYGKAQISQISEITFTDYFVSEAIMIVENIDFDLARKKARTMDKDAQYSYIVKNYKQCSWLFRANIKNNINASPYFLIFPEGYEHPSFVKYMETWNNYSLTIHYLFLVLIFPVLLFLFRAKNYRTIILMGFLYLLELYILISSGISFSQGDRLVIPALVLGVFLYMVVIYAYVEKFKEWIMVRK